MEEELSIVYLDEPDWETIVGGIRSYNTQQAGEDHAQSLCFVLRGPDQEVVGGVIGATYWDWLHLDLMWVQEELRGRGYGRRLLEHAEAEARRRGATHAFWTPSAFRRPGSMSGGGIGCSASWAASRRGTRATS